MEIMLNNRKETVDGDEISVADLILKKKFTFKMLVTKVNGKLVKKDERDEKIVRDGDEVTILHLISGG